MSAITTRIYMQAVEEFAQHFNAPPDRLGLEHARQYQAHLFTDRKLEAVSVAPRLSRSETSWHWIQRAAHGTAARRFGLIASSQSKQVPKWPV